MPEDLPGAPESAPWGIPPKPVTIRGVDYSSQSVAARALGVTSNAICMAARRGRLDGVGLSAAANPDHDTQWHSRRTITVRGVSYPSVKACAVALGVTRNNVYAALRRDRLDGLGLGNGRQQADDVFRNLSLVSAENLIADLERRAPRQPRVIATMRFLLQRIKDQQAALLEKEADGCPESNEVAE